MINTTQHYNQSLKEQLRFLEKENFHISSLVTPVKGLGAISHPRSISMVEYTFPKIDISVKIGKELCDMKKDLTLRNFKSIKEALNGIKKALKKSTENQIAVFRAEEDIPSYREGDLIYGLSDIRLKYLEKTNFSSSKIYEDAVIFIDQYPVTEMEQKKHIRTAPDDLDSFITFLNNHPKYKSAVNAKPKVFYGHTVDTSETLGRKIKGGLLWATDKSKKIHFLLDSIDMKMVVQKNHKDDTLDRVHRAHTGQELRFVYRNRFNIMLMKNVQFWINGKPTTAPWTKAFQDQNSISYDVVELWSSYKP
ncbi:hypothetical protein [uncultured Endozoicomonas sp.]|uniref:hypothetical protein n=1 Tax=uncultured Endozoicomonas sp. TaxID=432652 RepID=UPI00261D1C0D|nr:hypothetical protein [uncultured Endozoicomonas sp.]